ncbi:MAG: 2-oxoglutarate dehydrogenase E1 component [Deltaproteobacteria bacterium]|nr:2-oxoglutarate dehydrogenase E1 component [Deltaproteobacteria bacterium]
MSSYLNPLNTGYIEELAEQYRKDPENLDPSWRYFFDGLALRTRMDQALAPASGPREADDLEFELKVLELIQTYRELGFLIADVNPLQRGIKNHPLLRLDKFGLHDSDLDKICDVGNMLGLGRVTLREIIRRLTVYYCSPASVEYGHIEDPPSRAWIQKRIESNYLNKDLPNEARQRCLQKLVEAEAFETFLHKRFVGQKRFSVEGNDIVVGMLDFLIDQASQLGADEILIAMAHRGRLNVLANIFKKDFKQMMGEFSGNFDANVGDGDVKYHMGYSTQATTASGKDVHLSLAPNPSHLEAVNSVLMGICRSKQKLKGDKNRTKTLAVMLHGDASFTGQGSIYELLNMSDLAGYTVGGVIHIIVNNQIGFTTMPQESRSTPQCTDVAKMLEFPIFHVNADVPDAALRCVSLALQFRYKFKRDVVIDVVGYRRFGHNEADEPAFTQPLMYRAIANHPRVRQIYAEKLAEQGLADAAAAEAAIEEYSQNLDDALAESKKNKISPMMHAFGDRWQSLRKATDKDIFKQFATGMKVEELRRIGERIESVPPGFTLHPKIEKLIHDRRDMLEGKRGVDWSMGEALAFGSLLCQGHMVRLAGQDSERGTFSQRHCIFHDIETGRKYNPFNFIQDEQKDFEVVNSLLSEYAAMGFEFGQSITNPGKLTIWEAQFGDFVNSAQVIVDQFVICSAAKWQRYSGLVLLLPHGYEGQGPEHSSARLERFLQACAQNNIQVCNLTTPAQYFHLLRRQVLRDFRIPLVVMSPKSLLRHPLVISDLKDFQDNVFQEVLDDPDASLKDKAQRMIFCSGKIYYELLEARQKAKNPDIPLLRVEQFYPFSDEQYAKLLASYPKVTEIVWCQEGPRNMEGWTFMKEHLAPLIGKHQTLIYVGRAAQASPADSYLHLHQREQKRIVMTALGDAT